LFTRTSRPPKPSTVSDIAARSASGSSLSAWSRGHAAGMDDLPLQVVRWALGLSVGERHGGAIGGELPDDAGAGPSRTTGEQRSPACERGPGDVVESCSVSHDVHYISNGLFALRTRRCAIAPCVSPSVARPVPTAEHCVPITESSGHGRGSGQFSGGLGGPRLHGLRLGLDLPGVGLALDEQGSGEGADEGEGGEHVEGDLEAVGEGGAGGQAGRAM